MIDHKPTMTTEDDEQADAVTKDTLGKDTLEDLDVTTDEGANVKGGIPRATEEV